MQMPKVVMTGFEFDSSQFDKPVRKAGSMGRVVVSHLVSDS